MYKSFEIKNYRCFDSFKINQLSRVNLIAGRNNSGKSSFLEALWIHQGGGRAILGVEIERLRGIPILGVEDFLYDLFKDFRVEKDIEISSKNYDDKGTHLRISIKKQKTFQIPKESLEEEKPVQLQVSRQVEEPISDKVLFEFNDEKGAKRKSSVYFTRAGVTVDSLQKSGRPDSIILGAQIKMDPRADANRFGKVRVSKKQKSIITILKKVEPRLSDIETISKAGQPMLYGDIGHDKLFPIALLGGGTDRLLSISLAFSDLKNGIILIDEIEDGFHHSTLVDVWRSIDKLSREYNTQVFAATHSHDCILAAHAVFSKKREDDFHLHRFDKRDDTIEVVTYDKNTLDVAIKSDLEVR